MKERMKEKEKRKNWNLDFPKKGKSRSMRAAHCTRHAGTPRLLYNARETRNTV